MPQLNLTNMHSPRSWQDCHKIMSEWRENKFYARGKWGVDEAPLDGRSKPHLKLRLRQNDRYTLYLYETAMVEYEQDGTVHVRRPGTRSDTSFLGRTLPRGVHLEGLGNSSRVRFDSPSGVRYGVPGASPVVLTPAGGDCWYLVEGIQHHYRATLAYRHIPRLARRIEKLVQWRSAAMRLGLDPRHHPLPEGVSTADICTAIDRPEMWSEIFAPYLPERLLGVCAIVEGLLEIVGVHITPDFYSPPPAHWIARIPQLKNVREMKFV